jgi:hypothetical protein
MTPTGFCSRSLEWPIRFSEEVKMDDNETDPLSQFGIDAIDLRWTLKDIAAKRAWLINKQHLEQLIELGLVEMREDVPYLTIAGQNTVWQP